MGFGGENTVGETNRHCFHITFYLVHLCWESDLKSRHFSTRFYKYPLIVSSAALLVHILASKMYFVVPIHLVCSHYLQQGCALNFSRNRVQLSQSMHFFCYSTTNAVGVAARSIPTKSLRKSSHEMIASLLKNDLCG